MKKPLNEVLEILDGTIANMKTLKEEQFNYSNFVTEFDQKTLCGTVCCVAGWYPVWYPQSSFGYTRDCCLHKMTLTARERIGTEVIIQELRRFHGLSKQCVCTLFYGESYDEYGFEENSFLKLPKVIERFEKMRNLLATGEMPLNYSEQ